MLFCILLFSNQLSEVVWLLNNTGGNINFLPTLLFNPALFFSLRFFIFMDVLNEFLQ